MASMRMNNLFENISHTWAHLKDKTLFLACSGGVDSMTLLHILHRANFRLEVIHINYQLREEDSERICIWFNKPVQFWLFHFI
jgi:tRNA(Ile)-lysidine synthase